jgi:hypothetical protein
MAEMFLTGTSGLHTPGRPTLGQHEVSLPKEAQIKMGIEGLSSSKIDKALDILQKASPWLDRGLEPPRGLDPEIDKIKLEQNNLDLDNLDDAFKAAQGTNTLERSPEAVRQFVAQHSDAWVGIPAEAINGLLGDKAAETFGYVPGMAQELKTALATRTDVHIPLPDFITKTDPEVYRELRDDLRVRPGGITKNEAKLSDEQRDEFKAALPKVEGEPEPSGQPEVIPEFLPAFRNATGLDPLFSIGDRKLTLKRREVSPKDIGQRDAIPSDEWRLMDENGQKVGWLEIVPYDNGTRLYVDNVGGFESKGYGPNSFGPSLLKHLIDQIKAEYPEAKQVGGFRISGAREKAGTTREVWVKIADDLNSPEGWDAVEAFRQALEGGEWRQIGETGREAYVKPKELYSANERALVDAVNSELQRIAPSAQRQAVSDIREPRKEQEHRGLYLQYERQAPIVMWSLAAQDPVGVARHEAIHHLYRSGFFSQPEWETLVRAARDNGWIEKFGIERRYAGLDMPTKLEEAIAEGYRSWRDGASVRPEVHGLFERLKSLLEGIKAKFKEILGHEPTWDELFQKVDTGEVGGRKGAEPLDPRAFREAPTSVAESVGEPPTDEVAQANRLSKADAVGMTVDQFNRYMKLIRQRHAEDFAASHARALKEEQRAQSAEWKANEAQVRSEVTREVRIDPDVAVDMYFGAGEYLGGKLSKRPKLDADALTPEQKALIPKDYYAKGGENPDTVANAFGFASGDAMLAKMGDYNGPKMQANMSAREYSNRLIGMKTEEQMSLRYGDLEAKVLEEAKDRATSETQLNLLHEEMHALGLKHGFDKDFITREQVRSWVKDEFDKTPIEKISEDAYLQAAGRTGRETELALLKGDYADAFQSKQQQYIALQFANYARGLEKQKKAFDKIADRYSERVVSGATPEYTDAVHDILMRLGETNGGRSVQDLQESFAKNGYGGLKEFVEAKTAQLYDLHVPEWLQDPNFRKPTGNLTAREFTETKTALDALTYVSRMEAKVNKAGEKADLQAVLDEMIAKIKSLGPAQQVPIGGPKPGVKSTVKSWWWSGITVETMLNRLDRDDPRGIFYQTLTHQYTEASNYKDRLIKQYQSKLAALGKIEDIDKQVANDLFKDPLTGEYFPMQKRNVLGILQQAGNKNNLWKLASGYGLETSQVLDWLHARTTKEDWDRAQKIGDVFNELYDLANNMSHHISGVSIQRLPLEPIDTPFGQYAGWYNPVKYDKFRPGGSRKLMGGNVLEDEGHFRATTPQGWFKERTGYVAPVELNLDVIPQRMKQMIHDIAMRPAVLQMAKIFYNPKFEQAMTAHYGPHQAKEMIPFLRDIANSPNFKSMSTEFGDKALEYFRQNTIATLIGLNPSTVMKHGTTAFFNSMTEVGALNYLHQFWNIMAETINGRKTWKESIDKSEELQRRMRNFNELIQGHGAEMSIRGSGSTFMTVRELVMNMGAKPVAVSDLVSAVPTWAAEYKRQISEGADEGMAVSLANRAVRKAHGSSVLSNKPAIARTNALGAYFSSLYGFFSHMQQKQYELAWKASDMIKGERDAKRTIPELAQGLFSYVILPAVVEELVTPMTNDEHESWGKKAATTVAMGVSSSFIGVRDFVRAVVNVRDPQAGLLGTTFKTGTDLARDLSKGKEAFTKDKAANILKHTFALNGVLTGLTNAQEGKLAEYIYNYAQGREKPKGPWDALVGARYGTTDKHSRTFDEWRRHNLGGK